MGRRSNLFSRVILVGPPAVGKSAVGKSIASLLGWTFVDLDDEIESAKGSQIKNIFRVEGEQEFRRAESACLELASQREKVVIATGAGAVLAESNRKILQRAGWVVHLDAVPETLAARAADAESEVRPLLEGAEAHPVERLRTLRSERLRFYEEVRHARAVTDFTDPDTVASAIKALCFEKGIDIIPFRFASLRQVVVVGWTGELRKLTDDQGERTKIFAVADENVARSAGKLLEPLRKEADSFLAVAAGEEVKTISFVEKVLGAFASEGLPRDGVVAAIGGGVIGDTVGFAASSYMRGVKLLNIPTTLVAQVDAAIGGKTGVNLPQGKNLAGAFHPAAFVLSNPQFLETLPEREFRAGLSEVVKTALIDSEEFFSWLESNVEVITKREPESLRRIVFECSRAKVSIVAADPFEQGEKRRFLNFGHTVGHALEKLTNYRQFLHGEAVAIGLAAALRMGQQLDKTAATVAKRGLRLLERFELPSEIPKSLVPQQALSSGVRDEEWLRALASDKKREKGKVNLVLLKEIGVPLLFPIATDRLLELIGRVAVGRVQAS